MPWTASTSYWPGYSESSLWVRSAPPGVRATTSVKVPPRAIQKCHRPSPPVPVSWLIRSRVPAPVQPASLRRLPAPARPILLGLGDKRVDLAVLLRRRDGIAPAHAKAAAWRLAGYSKEHRLRDQIGIGHRNPDLQPHKHGRATSRERGWQTG